MSSQVTIQGLKIGGNSPVRVESMLKVPLTDIEGCVSQCERLLKAGCEMARVALPDSELAPALKNLIGKTSLRLMADIHFDPDIAIAAMENGCSSVRINPGNMSTLKLAEMISRAKDSDATIRIGANGGSLGNSHMQKANGDRALALFYAVAEQAEILISNGFDKNIILSAKSSNVPETVRANSLIANKYDYPIHIGITEAGFGAEGIVKGAVGIGLMLARGIGDTLRVSLTDEPEQEVRAGYAILNALGIRRGGIDIISCPTCGRRRMEVKEIIKLIEPLIAEIPEGAISNLAVMGCEVNGPREAKHADFGIAGTPNGAVIFKKGEVIGSFPIQELPDVVRKLLIDSKIPDPTVS
ncbi:MAG: flavodoxin-dependent (E)-4-hydroxy-3-methylbut-2-enyl-diphosphate synthase [Synergistaceae bacterium]|nr:flavodoxin-dependent (E)-4-hydroxy-3-methylbut-2-enyl-diphosphate synthase [Synergistaceae bacterium]